MSDLTMPSKQKDDGVHGAGYNQGIDDCMPFIEQLQRKNDALVAKAANLEMCLKLARNWLSGHDVNPKQVQHIDAVLKETESESLAHIQADAVEKAVEELNLFAFYMHGRGNMICEHSLRNYAKQLRQQQTSGSDGNDD